MTQLPNVNGAAPVGDRSSDITTALNDVNLDDFLNIMIAELQNQDPLNPLENDELIAQISQIREVGATEELTSTLEAVLLGQNIASATTLIGADVVGMTDDGERVSGSVQRVTVNGGEPKLDLAVGTSASAAADGGEVEEGDYLYEVTWVNGDGQRFSVQIEADTEKLDGFAGAIALTNLPATSVPKEVYRTDRTGGGDLKLVGEIASGAATSFVDGTSDADLSKTTLTGDRSVFQFANVVTVRLNNVAQIEPPR